MCPSGTTYVKRKRLSLFIIELITTALVSDNMTRKKVHLTKYVRRRNFAYRATLSGFSRVKRSREIASLQSPYKSPFKSPHSQASPARKKVKSDNNHQSKSQSKSPFRPSPLRERKVHGNVWFKSPLRSPFLENNMFDITRLYSQLPLHMCSHISCFTCIVWSFSCLVGD